MSKKHLTWLHIGIILLFGIASYANSLEVPRQLDDDAIVRVAQNHGIDLFSIQAFISRSRWFTDITFALNRHFHGEQVTGFHLLNLIVHLSSAIICYLIIRQILEALKRTWQISADDTFLQQFVPLTTAVLFVCHPIQTQAVTYISQRYTSLATLLYLGSLLSYLTARLSPADTPNRWHGRLWATASIVAALLAMKSKEIAFTLPLMLISLEVMIFRGKLLKNRIFLAICSILLTVIPVQLLYSHDTGSVGTLMNHIQAAVAETDTISRADYLLTQQKVVATYLRLLVFPVNQNLDYDYPVSHSLFDPSVAVTLLLHLAFAGLAVTLFIRSKKQLGCGPFTTGIAMRLASLGIFWFYLALSVESSVIPIRDVIFEHRVYLPSVGFFMAAAAGLALLPPRYHTFLRALAALLCLSLAAGSAARNRIWADEMTLWQDVLKKSPRKARARHSIGLLYFRKYQPEKALPYLVGALELDRNNENYWISLNDTIAITGKFLGRCSDGARYHATINTVHPAYLAPWLAISYNNMGLAYEHMGNPVRAREYFLKATAINPSLDFAWYNLASISSELGDAPAATAALQQLQAINPMMAQNALQIFGSQLPASGKNTAPANN